MSTDSIDTDLRAALLAITEAAARIGVSPSAATQGVTDVGPALDVLGALEQVLKTLPECWSQRDATLMLRASRADLMAGDLARQRSMLPLVTRQMARLRAARTVDDLVDSLPEATAALGYERVLFSWIEHEKWVPRSSHTMSGPEESRAMLAAGGPPYISVRELLEVEVVRKQSPILVLDADTNPRVHPKIEPVTKSVTYVASPIVAHNRVAGIIHIDRNVETGLNDEFDRDLLAYFCQGAGIVLERLVDLSRGSAQPLPSATTERWFESLTVREREVLALIASGSTNAQIGSRLYISEGTAKTHVKSLMRKLGVSNRSQAGALYHRLRTAGA